MIVLWLEVHTAAAARLRWRLLPARDSHRPVDFRQRKLLLRPLARARLLERTHEPFHVLAQEVALISRSYSHRL